MKFFVKFWKNGDEMTKLQIFLFSVNANFRMHNGGVLKKTEFLSEFSHANFAPSDFS